MAWESRIANESVRRVVLAAIMLTLLAASTALAVWMSASPSVGFDPLQPTHQLGEFRFAVPSNWQPEPPPRGSNPDTLTGMRFIAQPAAEQHAMLKVLLLNDGAWRVPMHAMDEARTRMMPIMPAALEQTLSYGPVSVLQYAIQSRRQRDAEIITQKDALAVATVDGRAYLAFYLTGLGPLRSDDLAMIQRVALSVTDQQYNTLNDRSWTSEGATVHLPAGLLALRPEQDGDGTADDADHESLLIAPNSSQSFFRMRLSVVRTDQLRQQWQQHGIAEAKTAPASKLIDEQLKARYVSINHARPPADAMRTFDLGTRSVRVIVLDNARLQGQQREWWASELDDQHVLLLELLADVRAIAVANRAAAQVVGNVEIQPADDASPAPHSETTSP